MRKYNQFDSIILKDGRVAAIVDFIGDYYIVDVGSSPEDWDTIEVREEEIVGIEDDFNAILRLIRWWKNTDTQGIDSGKYFYMPLLDRLGEDEETVLSRLECLSQSDLEIVSGCFEDVYRKFTTEKVWNALEVLEKKIQREE
jgi:hypothetical protein